MDNPNELLKALLTLSGSETLRLPSRVGPHGAKAASTEAVGGGPSGRTLSEEVRMSSSHTARAGRGVRLAVAAFVVAVAATLLAPAVQAAPLAASAEPSAVDAIAHGLGIARMEATRRLQAQDRLAVLAERLSRTLGTRAAGSRIDPARGELVVNVLDRRAAKQVRVAGARPHLVTHSLQRLERVKAALDRDGGAPGLAWSVDVVSNSVVIAVPQGRTDARTAGFLARARSKGVAVRVERVAGPARTQAFYGGQAVYAAGGGRCSAGFITQSSRGDQYVLTAGHCTEITSSWSDGDQTIGPTAASSFPGNDYGAIRISNPDLLGPEGAVLSNDGVQDITGASRVPIGATVCMTGSTTGTACGQVRRYNVTVSYPQGVVSGLTETDVCTQAGDSGGPLFAGGEAQGMVSGGTTGEGCGPSFRSYFQPVDEALSAYGLALR
jgi:streptogrisin D